MKKILMLAVAVVATSFVSGCYATNSGSHYVPAVSAQTSPAAHAGRDYYADLSYCQNVARSTRAPADAAITRGVSGAAIGAGLGAITGAIIGGGNVAEGAGIGALAGGALGVTSGAMESTSNREDVVVSCMRDHGWSAY